MSAAVIQIPIAATSFYCVRRYGGGQRWFVELVTPCEGGRPIVTKLGSHPRREAAVEYARQLGARLQRLVRQPEGSS